VSHKNFEIFQSRQSWKAFEHPALVRIVVFSVCYFILLFRFFAPEREFSNERRRNERQAEFLKARTKQQFTDAFGGYLEWICQAGILQPRVEKRP
jgi:hypothetical protein